MFFKKEQMLDNDWCPQGDCSFPVKCVRRDGPLGLIDLFVKAHMMLTRCCQTLPNSDAANVCQAKPLKLHLFKPDFCLSIPIPEESRGAMHLLHWHETNDTSPSQNSSATTDEWHHKSHSRVKEVCMCFSQSVKGVCERDLGTRPDPTNAVKLWIFIHFVDSFY